MNSLKLNINSKSYKVTSLDRGAFVTAYSYGKNKVIINVINCRFREALSQLEKSIPHLPKVKKLDSEHYIMPFYENIGIDCVELDVIKDIRYLLNSGIVSNQKLIMDIVKENYPTFSKAVEFIIEFVINNDECGMDLSYCNVGLDNKGNIILRDPVADYDAETIDDDCYSSSDNS